MVYLVGCKTEYFYANNLKETIITYLYLLEDIWWQQEPNALSKSVVKLLEVL